MEIRTASNATLSEGKDRRECGWFLQRGGRLAHVGLHRSSLIDCPALADELSIGLSSATGYCSTTRGQGVSQSPTMRERIHCRPSLGVSRDRAALRPSDLSPPLSSRQISFSSLDLGLRGVDRLRFVTTRLPAARS